MTIPAAPPKLCHKHILVTATGLAKPPTTPAQVEKWLLDLVTLVRMNVFFGPFAKRCDTPGNEGVTGIVGLETSHASLHVWDTVESPFLQMDLYSCQEFNVAEVLGALAMFEPGRVRFRVVDRDPSNPRPDRMNLDQMVDWPPPGD